MFLALLIIIAPIFIVFILFNSTRYLFDNWVAYLIRYCLEPVLIIGGMIILVELYEVFLDQVLNHIVNHIVFGAVKNPVIASYNLPNSVILSLIHLFILAQNFSIGFKSGEYGGRKIILQPTDSMSSLVFCDL